MGRLYSQKDGFLFLWTADICRVPSANHNTEEDDHESDLRHKTAAGFGFWGNSPCRQQTEGRTWNWVMNSLPSSESNSACLIPRLSPTDEGHGLDVLQSFNLKINYLQFKKAITVSRQIQRGLVLWLDVVSGMTFRVDRPRVFLLTK